MKTQQSTLKLCLDRLCGIAVGKPAEWLTIAIIVVLLGTATAYLIRTHR